MRSTPLTNTPIDVRNNLFRNSALHFVGGKINWTVCDNLFDTCTVNDHNNPVQHAFNAYYQTTNLFTTNSEAGMQVLTNLVYDPGPLGAYYQPTTSTLTNAGSTNAASVGFYHFTTQTNQVKEANSQVDIGLHYLAVTNIGGVWLPIDTDNDGLPDYVEDHDGNGVKDVGETAFNNPDTDGDGLTDYEELMVFHTDPNQPDPPFIIEQPLNQSVQLGDTVTFSVTAVGAQPLTYQWFCGTNAILNETNTSLSFFVAVTNQQDSYTARVTNSLGLSVSTTNATLTALDLGNLPAVAVIGPRQNYTFQNGITYEIGSRVELYGTTTIQGGAVIKVDPYATETTLPTLAIMGTLVCKTDDPYYPAFLTSVDDDTVGVLLDSPYLHLFNNAPYLDLSSCQDPHPSLNNLRIRFTDQGVVSATSRQTDVWHCQFLACNSAIAAAKNATIALHNVLIVGCGTAVAGPTNFAALTCEQVTADVTNLCAQFQPNVVAITNSIILGALPTGPALITNHALINPTSPVFQQVDFGLYYLSNTSPYRSAGTAAISPRLSNDLRQRTTQAPISFPAFMTAANDWGLGPQTARYFDGAPDYGFHYPAVDYTVSFLTNTGNITLLPGTSIGCRYGSYDNLEGGPAYGLGFDLREGSTFTSHGTPTKPIVFVDLQLVQELPTYPCHATFVPDVRPYDPFVYWLDPPPGFDGSDKAPPSLDLRFSHFYANPNSGHLWSGNFYSLVSLLNWNLRDCSLHGGQISLGPLSWLLSQDLVYGACSISWSNSLFDNVVIDLRLPCWGYNGPNSDMAFQACNNLFRGGRLILEPVYPTSAGNWTFMDNLFDQVYFWQDTDIPLDCHHNAYWPINPAWWGENTLYAEPSAGTGEQTLTSPPPYQPGPLGDYYLPNTTPLYHAGSRTAAAAGLYHYTTCPDQTKEGTNQMVNIGLHYVATTNGLPIDTDGDGIPDFVENWHGDGSYTNHTDDETDWQTAYTATGVYDPTNTIYDNTDLSGNGLVGRIKAALGLGPFETSNPLTLTQIAFNQPWGIVTNELPISYTTLTNIGVLHLNLDGFDVTLQDSAPATNGHVLLNWNTTYEAPGLHFAQAQISLNGVGDDDAILTGLGPLTTFYSDNYLQFFEAGAIFSHTNAFLDAQVVVQDADYTITLYDPSTTPPTFITAITNSTCNGLIQEDWNLTYSDGVTAFTNGAFDAVFDVTLLDSPTPLYRNFMHLAQNIETPILQKQHRKRLTPIASCECLANECLDGFDFVYMYTPTKGQPSRAAFNNRDGFVWNGMWGVVESLIYPNEDYDVYSSTFNGYDDFDFSKNYPGYVDNINQVHANLYPSMADGTTKEFYCYAHGSCNTLCDCNNSARITLTEVESILGNTRSSGELHVTNPYRFVFLDACLSAATPDWRRAFGIFPRWATNNVLTTQTGRTPLGPQAFVGWAKRATDWIGGSHQESYSRQVAEGYMQTLARFYRNWMSGYSLYQCLTNASDTNAFGVPLPVPSVKWAYAGWAAYKNTYPSDIYVVGHSGLKVSDWNPDADGYFQSAKDLPNEWGQ